jgi:hypothetical protein
MCLVSNRPADCPRFFAQRKKTDADEQNSSEDSTNSQCYQEGHAHLINPFFDGDYHAIAPIKVSG